MCLFRVIQAPQSVSLILVREGILTSGFLHNSRKLWVRWSYALPNEEHPYFTEEFSWLTSSHVSYLRQGGLISLCPRIRRTMLIFCERSYSLCSCRLVFLLFSSRPILSQPVRLIVSFYFWDVIPPDLLHSLQSASFLMKCVVFLVKCVAWHLSLLTLPPARFCLIEKVTSGASCWSVIFI